MDTTGLKCRPFLSAVRPWVRHKTFLSFWFLFCKRWALQGVVRVKRENLGEMPCTHQRPHEWSVPDCPAPAVSRARTQPYLGVEHRIESIHIHIFTHQLQEETRGCRGMRLGGRAGVSGSPRPRSWGGQQEKGEGTIKANAGLWVHCLSKWGAENWGPLYPKVL